MRMADGARHELRGRNKRNNKKKTKQKKENEISEDKFLTKFAPYTSAASCSVVDKSEKAGNSQCREPEDSSGVTDRQNKYHN